MGTKRTELIGEDLYENLNSNQLSNLHCELLREVEMRDGSKVPMVIKYDKRFYNESSPWVLVTWGMESKKSDVMWSVNDFGLTSRGIVCAYPLLRGTHYFDSDWLQSGIAHRKFSHLTDFMDAAIFVKEKKLGQRIGVLGLGQSGGFTALAAIFKEPYLFESCVTHNAITDLVSHLMEERSETEREGVIEEWGDPALRTFYEAHKAMSPYHQPIINP
jgi:protease II